MGNDYAQIIRTSLREDFVRTYGGFYLVGASPLVKMPRPGRTLITEGYEEPRLPREKRLGSETLLILVVRKIQSTFPQMITLGRAANNDVVVPDTSVSKFHAYFRISDGRSELSDAGSRNGTYLDGRSLEPRVAAPIKIGDHIRFGQTTFRFVDAGTLWDRLRRP